eukprot:1927450-Rhodomonas_salina.1
MFLCCPCFCCAMCGAERAYGATRSAVLGWLCNIRCESTFFSPGTAKRRVRMVVEGGSRVAAPYCPPQ